MAVEDRVVLGASDLFRGAVEVVEWPFEKIAPAFERWIVWPIEEKTVGWGRPARAGALAAVLLLAVAAVAAGIKVSGGSDSGGSTEVATVPAIAPAAAQAQTQPQPQAAVKSAEATGPVLHGAKPEFSQESGGGVPPSSRAEAAADAKAVEGTAKVSPGSATATPKGNAAAAGPAAIEVARKFAGAFVLYETGQTNAHVKSVFGQTTAPDLEQALLKRPPRLPANVKVPEAKVLNIVSGPKQGATYNLSISLLRVGVTSELKVEMQRVKGRWVITDVQG